MNSEWSRVVSAAAAAKKQEQLSRAPACPLCGEPMLVGVYAWMCPQPKVHLRWMYEVKNFAREAGKRGEVVTTYDLEIPMERRLELRDPRRHFGYEDDSIILGLYGEEDKFARLVAISGVRGFYEFSIRYVDGPDRPLTTKIAFAPWALMAPAPRCVGKEWGNVEEVRAMQTVEVVTTRYSSGGIL